jgi:hypothetical protein
MENRITTTGDCSGCGVHVQSMEGEDCDYCECPSAGHTITVRAIEAYDDCLQGAADDLVADHPDLADYDLSARWGDEDRETVRMDVPRWFASAHPDRID